MQIVAVLLRNMGSSGGHDPSASAFVLLLNTFWTQFTVLVLTHLVRLPLCLLLGNHSVRSVIPGASAGCTDGGLIFHTEEIQVFFVLLTHPFLRREFCFVYRCQSAGLLHFPQITGPFSRKGVLQLFFPRSAWCNLEETRAHKAIHEASNQQNKPFVTWNISESGCLQHPLLGKEFLVSPKQDNGFPYCR